MRNLTLQQLKQDAANASKPAFSRRRRFPRKTHAKQKMPGIPAPSLRSDGGAWKLVMDNYPLVLKAIQMMGLNRRPNAGPDDVLQNALISAHDAALKWDPQRGRFSSYLFYSVRGALRLNVEEKLLIHIPSFALQEIKKYQRWKDQNPHLDISAYAEWAGISLKSAARIADGAQTYSCCLNPPNANSLLEFGPSSFRVGESMERTREVQLNDLDPSVVHKMLPFIEEGVDGAKLAEHICAVFATLTPREREILKFRFGIGKIDDGKTLVEAAEHFNITPQGVRRIEFKSLRKLRHSSRSKYLRGHV